MVDVCRAQFGGGLHPVDAFGQEYPVVRFMIGPMLVVIAASCIRMPVLPV